MIEAREIEAFLAVADELHFGRAAARLHLSPTRISQTVQALERRIGGRLFERSSRRVRLTPLGAQLLGELRPAYQRLREVLADAQRSAGAPHQEVLRIAFSSSLPATTVATLTGACIAELPDVTLVRYSYPAMQHRRWCDQPRDDVYVHSSALNARPATCQLVTGSPRRNRPLPITLSRALSGRATSRGPYSPPMALPSSSTTWT